jgi:uncharacterized protein (DUF2062 family)
MLRRFLRRHLPGPVALRGNRQLRFALGELLHDPNLWHLNRRSVSGGVAIGLFVAWVPLPVQTLLAALAALVCRVNLALSVVVVWVTNPVTIAPMFWSAWRIGESILGSRHEPQRFELTVEWLSAELGQIWQPLLLGCAILGALSAGLGYLICRLAWRYHVVRTILQRRRKRAVRADAQHRDNSGTHE